MIVGDAIKPEKTEISEIYGFVKAKSSNEESIEGIRIKH